MAFRDLDEFRVAEPPVVLSIRGREYTFPAAVSIPAWLLIQSTGRRAQNGSDSEAEALSEADEALLTDAMFGDCKQQMIDDGCTGDEFRIVFATLFARHLYGTVEAAEAIWNAQASPPEDAPNRAARRSKPAAKSTRAPGSRAGSNARKAKAASPGPTSSSAGD